MILGIDHLALSVDATEKAKNELEEAGFICSFMEYNIANHAAKKNLLTHYQSTHDIGFFRPKNSGISIEITNHGSIADTFAPYHYSSHYIELKTSHMQKDIEFWKKVFQFKQEKEDTLKFNSLIPNWSCAVKFSEDKNFHLAALDSKGYSCLAFLTNNIENDTKIAKDAGGYDFITPISIRVNQRHLNIIMFRTPGGAICELIQIMKQNKSA